MYLYLVLLYTCLALQNDGIVALPRTTPMSKHGKPLAIHHKTAELIDLVNKFYHNDNKPGNAGKIRLNKSQSKFKGEQGNSRDIDDDYSDIKNSKKDTLLETVMNLLQKNYDAHKKYAPSGTDTIRLHVISNPEVVKEYQQGLKSAYIDRSSSSESSGEDYFDRKLREVLLRRNFVNFRLSSGDVSSEALYEEPEEVKATQGTVRSIDDEVTPFKQQHTEDDEMTNLEILLNSPDFIVKNEEKEIGKEVMGPHIDQIASKSGAWDVITKGHTWGDKLVADKKNGNQNWENTKRREKADTWETKKDSDWNKKDNWNKKSEGRKTEENRWMKEDDWKKPDEWNKKKDDFNKNNNDWNKKNSDWNKKPNEWNKKNNDGIKKLDDRDKKTDTWGKKDNWEKKDDWNKKKYDFTKKNNDWDKNNNAGEDIWNTKDKETTNNWNKDENNRNKDVDWYTKNKKNQRDKKKDWDNKDNDGNIKDNDWDKPKIDWDNDRDRKENKNNGRDKKENTNKEWDKNENTWDKKKVVLDQKRDNWDNKNIARGASDLTANKKRKKKNRDDDYRNLDRDETKALQSYERETTKKYNVKKIDNSWDSYVPKNDDYNYRPKKNKRVDNYERNDARPMAGAGHSFGRTSIPFAGRQRIYDK